MDLPRELIELEQAAWAEMQGAGLTVDTAIAVQAAITEHAAAAGLNRFEVERALKALVRHPDPDG